MAMVRKLSYLCKQYLPEAMLCAWLATGDPVYKEIARSSFDFLLSKIFTKSSIKVFQIKAGYIKAGRLHP